jgi:hypothetical protein
VAGGLCHLGEVRCEPLRALARLAGSSSAAGLVVTWARRRPRGEAGRSLKAGHVDTDLGDQALGDAAADARDRVQERRSAQPARPGSTQDDRTDWYWLPDARINLYANAQNSQSSFSEVACN